MYNSLALNYSCVTALSFTSRTKCSQAEQQTTSAPVFGNITLPSSNERGKKERNQQTYEDITGFIVHLFFRCLVNRK